MRSDNLIFDLRENYRGPDLQLFFRDIRDPQNLKRKILVKTWSTIQDVKNAISVKIQVSPQLLRLYHGPLIALPNHRTLSDAGIYKHGETLLLDILQENYVTETDLRLATYMCESTPKLLMDIIQQCRRGLAMGYKPELVLDGSGGTYFLHNSCKAKIAVFKPSDEEPYAENNPRGYVGDGILRAGIAPGQACLREVAAYLLDHSNFCRVPMTTLVEACHPAFHINGAKLNVAQGGASIGNHSFTPHKATLRQPKNLFRKVGSLQVFIKADCSMDDLSPSKLHKDEVHRIAILDIRLMNSDRNSANLLCRRRPNDGVIELIPIDHGFCLRNVCDVSWMDWCWLDWPQMKEPISNETKKYIKNLDIDSDCRLLKETLNIQGAALDFFRVSNKILKEGVKAGLSLYEIAIMCCRNDDLGEVPSKLEILTDMASELATSALNNGRWHHAAASRAIAQQLSPWNAALTSSTRFFSSTSCADFPSVFHMDLSNEVPGRALSSSSDASSDTGDVCDNDIERDECEEWAACEIARLSSEAERKDLHSCKCESDTSALDNLSTSPTKGFWITRPGEASQFDHDDDDTVIWSPTVSPKTSKNLFLKSFRNNPSDGFIEEFLLPPPASSARFRGSSALPVMWLRNQISSEKLGLPKSKSFAALHSLRSLTSDSASAVSNRIITGDESDQWKETFYKFVDLVIARETAAVAQTAVVSRK